MIRFTNRVSYTRTKTKEYDDIAMSHLGYALYPMVVGYAAFSLLYGRHKSWYSWVLTSLVNFVYVFGFVLMTPQLFINYKMKSVAHMPWRAMVYKALNTFIDDLFSFIIKMPTMHRLSCFRDGMAHTSKLFEQHVFLTLFVVVDRFDFLHLPVSEVGIPSGPKASQ